MYAPDPFRVADIADVEAFVDARRLATIVVAGSEGPVAAYAPLYTQRNAEGRVTHLVGHLARGNPVIALAAAGARALAIFHGEDAYVTPSWYPSKREHGKVVPTWNYINAEATGRLETFDAPETLLDVLEKLTDLSETGRPETWAVRDAPADYVARMLNAITGIRLSVDTLEGKRKLSQNKTVADHAGVLAGLRLSHNPHDHLLANEMTPNTTPTTTAEASAHS